MKNNNIGMDKLELYGLQILYIDHEYLEQLAIQTGTIDITRSCIDSEWYIKIRDNNVFQDLVLGRRMHGHIATEFCRLTLSPTHVCGTNWHNLSWSEYNDHLDTVLEYISARYHIELIADQMRLRQIEINCNIPLHYAYAEYDRSIKLLMSLLPGHLRNKQSYTSGSASQNTDPTYLSSNNTMGVTIYNKSAQMEQKQPNDEDIDDIEENEHTQDVMRIEMRLDTPEKIQSALKTNRWSELDDNKITDYYQRYIIDTLTRKYQQWLKKRRGELVRLVRTMRREHPKTWHHMTMQYVRNQSEKNGIPYILDIEQVVEALTLLPDKNRNRSRSIAALRGIKIDNDLYHRRDCDKVSEILNRLAALIPPSM